MAKTLTVPGRRVVTREQAGLVVPRRSGTGYVAAANPDDQLGATIHNTGHYDRGLPRLGGGAAAWKGIQKGHFARGWSDIAYSFGIALDEDGKGEIYEGRGLRWRQFANGSVTTGRTDLGSPQRDWISIQFMAGFRPLPEDALQAALDLVDALRDLGLGRQISGHREFKIKDCPDDYLWNNVVRKWDNRVIPDTDVIVVPAAPATLKGARFPLPKGHVFGDDEPDGVTPIWDGSESSSARAWVRLIQEKVDAEVDGYFGAETEGKVMTYQRAVGIRADGLVGTVTLGYMGK